MNIVEALKFSNSVINQKLRRSIDITNNKDTRHINLTTEEIFSNDWTPIVEIHEKIKVKKKFYQILISNNDVKYFLLERVFETLEQAKEYCEYHQCKLIRFLVENPIEIEVEV